MGSVDDGAAEVFIILAAFFPSFFPFSSLAFFGLNPTVSNQLSESGLSKQKQRGPAVLLLPPQRQINEERGHTGRAVFCKTEKTTADSDCYIWAKKDLN